MKTARRASSARVAFVYGIGKHVSEQSQVSFPLSHRNLADGKCWGKNVRIHSYIIIYVDERVPPVKLSMYPPILSPTKKAK
jgi:hypothetical protein